MNLLKIDEAWNPIIGCLYDCYYGKCWAKLSAEQMQKEAKTEKYKDGFSTLKLVESEILKTFRNKVVSVSFMGDMFSEYIPREWILKVLKVIRQNPDSTFLLLTKNPKRYIKLPDLFPANVILGSTIESNRVYPAVTKAPSVSERYEAMKNLQFKPKSISVEPIMDFDFEVFLRWLKDIEPIFVSVGYDQHGAMLTEPDYYKTKQFIARLKEFTQIKILNLRQKIIQKAPSSQTTIDTTSKLHVCKKKEIEYYMTSKISTNEAGSDGASGSAVKVNIRYQLCVMSQVLQ
jgi:DNA repair photolyase